MIDVNKILDEAGIGEHIKEEIRKSLRDGSYKYDEFMERMSENYGISRIFIARIRKAYEKSSTF